ncbi:hypothetical protein EGW08_016723 [Elysia chlorotica]|uniref:Uncharacterized protein n=1 Tax=Elysia chlorotica TaxID=188477 RepID=A0A3S1B3Z3_ELYCH|nr:hypothetical protein EGW08_016723 [Elysia chlorotica]
MAGQLTENSDIRNALAGIYRHFQTLDKAHLFDAVIAEERSPGPAEEQSSAHQPPNPAQENPALIRYVTKIPCNPQDPTANQRTAQSETIHDNKVYDRLATVEEDTAKLSTEFFDFKKTICDRLSDLEKVVQDLQEKLNSISSITSTVNYNTSGTSASTVDTDTGSGRSDSGGGCGSGGGGSGGGGSGGGADVRDDSDGARDNTNDYASIRNATTGMPTPPPPSTGVEHIYEDPRDFYPDSLPRYRAPPPPGPPWSVLRHTDSAPSVLNNAATSSPSSSQQQQLHQRSNTPRDQMSGPSPTTTTSTSTSLSRVVPPSEPLAQPPDAPRPPPRTAASASTPTPDVPFPPTSSPPRRPNNGTDGSGNPSRAAASVAQLRDNFQIGATNEPSRNPAISRSVSNPSSFTPPAVKPRAKPRVSSVGAPGFQTELNLQTVEDAEEDDEPDPERHESGTIAIRGIRTRPGLDIQTSESDTLIIGPMSPFLNTQPQGLGAGIGVQQSDPTSGSLSVPTPNTIHSIMFTIESMSRFKAASKKLAIHSFGIQIECSLKLQSKDQLLVRLNGTLLPGNSQIPGISSGRQQQQHQGTPASSPTVTRAHVCILHLGRDVSDDKILDQGWMLNIYQPCSMFLNPKGLFKVKGYVKLLVEIKIDEPRQSQC